MYSECRHIFTSGKKCQSPALKEQTFCYFHSNTRKRPTPANQPYDPYAEPQTAVIALPALEDADAIQLALSDVVLALAANQIDPRRARILIYGLQVASQNNRHRRVPQVREAEGAANLGLIVREIHEHQDGTLIGPEKQTPDAEEVAERTRPLTLGELLLRDAEALYGKYETEETAQTDAHGPIAYPARDMRSETASGVIDIQATTDLSPQDPDLEVSGHNSVQIPLLRGEMRHPCRKGLLISETGSEKSPKQLSPIP